MEPIGRKYKGCMLFCGAMGDKVAEERINESEKETERLKGEDALHESIEELALRAVEEPSALEKLCEIYINRIYGYVLKRIGNVEDAEDITSVVFEKVIANLDSYDSRKASFSTWIYKIAINCITDYYRSRGRKKEDLSEEVPTQLLSVSEDFIDNFNSYLYIIELLHKLPRKYQEAVTLRYFGGMKVGEVAETLGITETAASKRILRGLEKLKKLTHDSDFFFNVASGPNDEKERS